MQKNTTTFVIDVDDRVEPALDKIDNRLAKTTKKAEGLSKSMRFDLGNGQMSLSGSNRERFASNSLGSSNIDPLTGKKMREKVYLDKQGNTVRESWTEDDNGDKTSLSGNPRRGGRGLSQFGKASGMKGMGRFAGMARLGLAGPIGAIAAVGAVALATGKHLVDVSAEIRNNNQVIEQTFGLAGESAQKLSTQATALSRTFGDDYKTTVSAASTLTREFGLSGEAALSLIEKGYASGANKSGEMLAQISEYSDEMKALGITASQQVALLSQTDKVGGAENLIGIFEGVQTQLGILGAANKKTLNKVLGDGFIDGLTTQLKKGEISTAQATQKISQSLLAAKLPAAQFKESLGLIFGEAGENMGLGMVENLAGLNVNLDEAISKNAEFSTQLSEQLEWEKAIAAEQQQFAPTWAKIGDATSKAMNYLELGFYKTVNFASGLASSLYDANASVYGMVGNLLTLDFEGLAGNFADLRESITGEKAAAQASLNEAVQSQISLYQQKVKKGEDVSAMEAQFYQAANTAGGQYAQKALGISAKDYLANLRGEKTSTTSTEKTTPALSSPSKKTITTGKSKTDREMQQSERAIVSGGKETRNVTVNVGNLVGEIKISYAQNGQADVEKIRTEISNILLSAIRNAEIMSS